MTIQVRPSDMLVFAQVVREGGFSSGARGLGVTKQTVSERIARLEEALGVRLLERTTRQVRPTDAGATYYERCAVIATQIEEANVEVRQQQAEPVGLLRVSAPFLYGRRFLFPVVADYMKRYPKVRVEVLLADRRADLVAEGLDLAIRIGKLDDSSLMARRLGQGHSYYVASPAYLEAHADLTPKTLRHADCISMRAVDSWAVQGVRNKIEPKLVVNDLEIACEAAISGIGIARVPDLLCREPVLDGRLQVLFGPNPALVTPVSVVHPSRRYLPAKVRLFVEQLQRLVEPMRGVAPAWLSVSLSCGFLGNSPQRVNSGCALPAVRRQRRLRGSAGDPDQLRCVRVRGQPVRGVRRGDVLAVAVRRDAVPHPG